MNLPIECLTESFRMEMYSTGVLKKKKKSHVGLFSDNVEKKLHSFILLPPLSALISAKRAGFTIHWPNEIMFIAM